MLTQLESLFVDHNQLVGGLPESWSNLTSVSPIIELLMTLAQPVFLLSKTSTMSGAQNAEIERLNMQHWSQQQNTRAYENAHAVHEFGTSSRQQSPTREDFVSACVALLRV